MKSFFDVKEGEAMAFRLSREQWEALPYVDEADRPEHLQLFRDRNRVGVVYRWLGAPRSGFWWIANITIDDGLEPAPAAQRSRLEEFVRSVLSVRWWRA
jgi:hypothetical protein